MADPFAHCGGALGAGRVDNRYRGMTDEEYTAFINRMYMSAVRNTEPPYTPNPSLPAVDQVNDGVDQEYTASKKFDELVAKLQNVARTLDEIALAAMEVRP